jgi:predicted dehydrogenase
MAKTLKVGLIGTGSICGLHLGAYTQFPEKVQLTALCDIVEDTVRKRAKQARVDAIYTDYTKLLKEADVDAVDICTTHDQHAPIAIAAAEAGKHVLLEKPMAITMQECRDIIAATDKAGVTFMVAHDLRYLPSYQGVRQLIDEGELGRIWGARADVWQHVVLSRSALPPRFSELSEAARWRFDGKRSGGASLINAAVHHVDLLRYFVGDINRVTGTCWTDHPIFTNNAEDRAMAMIEFENGAIGHISNSWTTRTPWSFQFMLFGEEGTVYSDPPPLKGNALEQFLAPAMVSSTKRDKEGEELMDRFRTFVPVPVNENLPSDDPYINEIIHFAECCQEGKEPISSGKENLGTMKVIFGIYESSRTGKTVDLASL